MRVLPPKLMISLAGIVVVFILFSLAQEMNRRLQVQREVAKLQHEVRGLEKTIIEMESLNQYFNTDAFQERMAREKLNYRASGESVVLITEEQEESEPQIAGAQTERSVTSIPQRWWHVFFGNINVI